jgi:hypothetical protein
MARKLLVISYFTNEDGMACSHHIDDRLCVLQAKGVDCVLLSSWCVQPWQALKHYRVPSLSPSGIRFEVRRRFHRLVQRHGIWKFLRDLVLLPLLPLYGLERMFRRIDPTWYWHFVATPVGIWICRQQHIDTIYSTGGPPVAHTVAGTIAKWCTVRWMAEVQDPLIHGYCAGHDDELHKLLQVERSVYDRADQMIFLTEHAMQATEKRIGLTGKGQVIYPGAISLPQEKSVCRGNRLRIAHFGSLGGIRNLEIFIRGLEIAMERQSAIAHDIRVDLYGNVGEDDLQRIDASALRSLFVCKGLVSRQHALSAMLHSDILLLVQGVHDISRETIPSKCYEYFLSGKTVLGLLHENEELSAMFDRLGHVAVAACDSREIAEALLRLWSSWQKAVLPAPHPSPYTVEQAVKRLLGI